MNDHRPSQETLDQHDRAVNSIRDAGETRSAEKSKLAILESCILLELALADSGATDVFKKRSRAPTLLPLIRHYQLTMSKSPAEARVLKEAEEAIKLRNSHVHDAGFKSSVDADVGAAKALLAAARTIVDLPQADPAAGGVFAMRSACRPSYRLSGARGREHPICPRGQASRVSMTGLASPRRRRLHAGRRIRVCPAVARNRRRERDRRASSRSDR